MTKEKTGKRVRIILTSQECEVIKNICMEFLGSYKLKVGRERASILNKILDKLEGARK